jgi:hypothetical protein
MDLLAEWCDHAKVYEWMHDTCGDAIARSSQYWFLFTTVTSFLVSTLGAVSGDAMWGALPVKYLLSAIVLVNGLSQVLLRAFKFDAHAAEHKAQGRSWTLLRTNIQRYLTAPGADLVAFQKGVQEQLAALEADSNPMLPVWVQDAAAAKFRGVPDLCLPEACGGIKHTRPGTVVIPVTGGS